MTEMTIGALRNAVADAVNRVAYTGERIILRRRGKAVAALVPIEDAEYLEHREAEIDLKEAKRALREAKRKGTIPAKKVYQKLGL
jgi:prevent-host-death family protein